MMLWVLLDILLEHHKPLDILLEGTLASLGGRGGGEGTSG